MRSLYKQFKVRATTAVDRTRELVQRPNPPESIERVKRVMEDAAAAMNSFSTTLAIRKQQREEQRRQAARQAARRALETARKARSESERQFQLARYKLVCMVLIPEKEIHGKELSCYFCGLKGYRVRYCLRQADHNQYRRAETENGMRWVRSSTPN